MRLRDDFLWGGAIAANQAEGAYLEDGKGLSVADCFTAGEKTRRRAYTDGVMPDQYYPSHVATDFYHHWRGRRCRPPLSIHLHFLLNHRYFLHNYFYYYLHQFLFEVPNFLDSYYYTIPYYYCLVHTFLLLSLVHFSSISLLHPIVLHILMYC